MIDFATNYACAKAGAEITTEVSTLLVSGGFRPMLSPSGQWAFHYVVETKGTLHVGWVRGTRKWRLFRRAHMVVDVEAKCQVPHAKGGDLGRTLGISPVPDCEVDEPMVYPTLMDAGDPWLLIMRSGVRREFRIDGLPEAHPILVFVGEFKAAIERIVGCSSLTLLPGRNNVGFSGT